jgi:hypothetical protein
MYKEQDVKGICLHFILFVVSLQRCPYYFYYFIIVLSGVRLSPLGTAATSGLLYQPQMIDDGDVEQLVE